MKAFLNSIFFLEIQENIIYIQESLIKLKLKNISYIFRKVFINFKKLSKKGKFCLSIILEFLIFTYLYILINN